MSIKPYMKSMAENLYIGRIYAGRQKSKWQAAGAIEIYAAENLQKSRTQQKAGETAPSDSILRGEQKQNLYVLYKK